MVWVLSFKQKILVCIDDVFSEAWTLKYVVPQGSILGPLLLTDAGSYLYADDTCIFHEHEGVKKIKNVLNKEFLSLYQWFIHNKLSSHFGQDKTKSILLSKTRGLRKINISFAGHFIKQQEAGEYLSCQLILN